MKNYGTTWNSIDMNSPSQTGLELIDSLTFDTLLMEIGCNCPEINVETVTKQFEEDLQSRVRSAREVFLANRAGLIRKANQVRHS
jgi:hypothetical protein